MDPAATPLLRRLQKQLIARTRRFEAAHRCAHFSRFRVTKKRPPAGSKRHTGLAAMETKQCSTCRQQKPISDYTAQAKATCSRCLVTRRKQHANRKSRKLKQMTELQGQNEAMQACIDGRSVEVQRLKQVFALLQEPNAINIEA